MSRDTIHILQDLRRQLMEGVTGRLTTEASSGRTVEVFVQNGEVKAAHAVDDKEHLLRRLAALGHLDDAQAEQLRAPGQGRPFEEKLYEVLSRDLLLQVFFDRLRDNLTRFLASTGPCDFTPMETLLLTHPQDSHQTDHLLREAVRVLVRTTGLEANPPETVVVLPGNAQAAHGNEEVLLAQIGEEGRTLRELLDVSPFEPYTSLDLLVDMLHRGTAHAFVQTTPPTDAHASSFSVVAVLPDQEPKTPVTPGLRSAPPVRRRPLTPLTPVPGRCYQEGPDPAVAPEELAFFADHDQVRGALGDGRFTGTVQERVDLSDVLTAGGPRTEPAFRPEEQVVLALGNAEEPQAHQTSTDEIHLSFSTPELSDLEAREKLKVVNGVLSLLATAFDRSTGSSGSGHTRVQQLLARSPLQHALLFHQVEIRRNGSITPETILQNLRLFPAEERRRLLNSGLRDLLDRGLADASDSLEPTALEAMLASITGYQQAIDS